MKIDEKSRYVSLDWDNINLQEALSRFSEIISSPNVRKAILSLSARKGFHCRVWFLYRVFVAKCRFNLGDDPRRLLHDLFNRPDNIHDILWTRKTVGSVSKESKVLIVHEA